MCHVYDIAWKKVVFVDDRQEKDNNVPILMEEVIVMKKYGMLFLIMTAFATQGLANEAESVHKPDLVSKHMHVDFITPKQGDTVAQTFDVVMDVTGMKAESAGDVKHLSGHHHLIIDGVFIAQGEGVPKDKTHKHFGKGQSKTTLTLAPGEHTLTLQFADGIHSSYGQKMSHTIKITVK